ncbi:hypothetical protein KBX34_08305 [Micromonospora sp. M61]|nr:hypothetical protein [Micromonospora sp. M61]
MRFTADDLIAIKFLSVEAPKTAVRALLRDRSDEFSGLLVTLGPDRDLANENALLDHTWAGWRIMDELRSIPGVVRPPRRSCWRGSGHACDPSGTRWSLP